MMFRIATLLFSVILSIPLAVAADTGGSLYLSPSTHVYAVGDVFDIQLFANTGTSSVNAIEAELSFNPKVIAVDHISTGGSVLSSWPTPPEYSNTQGGIQFAGWVNNRFVGTDGKLLTITFRAVSVGQTPLTFVSGAMLAPEGQETNVVSTLRSGAFVVGPKRDEAAMPIIPTPEPATTTDSRPASTTVSSEDDRSAQSAGADFAATGNYWWSFTMLMIGCGIGMCIGYALRARA